MMATGSHDLSHPQALAVAHSAESLRRYPGERVALFTRAEVGADLAAFRVQIILPPGLKFEKFQTVGLPGTVDPVFSYNEGSLFLIWDMLKEPGKRLRCDFQVMARVEPTQRDQRLESRADLIAEWEGERLRADEAVTIDVRARGSYLKYLPSIYQDDELMGRLLMLYESFLAPVENQIAHMPDYLDARMAPVEMVPWLASWTGLVVDSDLSESQRRKLLWNAGSLFQRRGTRSEMQDYLEIVTGGKVEVNDAPAFRLGQQTFLGLGIALGVGNLPYMFHVSVHVPPLAADLSEEERARQVSALESKVRSVIDTEKPAHTGYELQIFYEDTVVRS
jgi:phage tail-like protein